MLTPQQRDEIHKYYLNALKTALATEANRKHCIQLDLDFSKHQNKEKLEPLAKEFNISLYDMQVINAAMLKATADTQSKVSIDHHDFSEITQAISAYKATLMPELIKDCQQLNGAKLWQKIDQNITQLDKQITIPNFFEKYSFEIETAGKVFGVAAALGLTFLAVRAAINQGNAPSVPSNSFTL